MEKLNSTSLKSKYEVRVTYTSIIMKTILVIAVLVGFILSFFIGDLKGYSCLLYFTILSNIWIAIVDIIILAFMVHSLVNKKFIISPILYKIQQVFTVCITITGIIYCFVLVPGFLMDQSNGPDGFSPFNFGSIMLHMLVPIIAVTDYFLTVRFVKFKYVDSVYVLIPTILYLGLSIMGYYLNWDYGYGQNFPYFFLNFDSPAGIFGFSDQMPYFMGTFYWIVIILILTMGLSLLYIKIIKMIDKKNLKRTA